VSGQNLYYSMDAQVEQVKKVMEVDSASEWVEEKGSAIEDDSEYSEINDMYWNVCNCACCHECPSTFLYCWCSYDRVLQQECKQLAMMRGAARIPKKSCSGGNWRAATAAIALMSKQANQSQSQRIYNVLQLLYITNHGKWLFIWCAYHSFVPLPTAVRRVRHHFYHEKHNQK
jgi:hypothetical protein